MLSIEILVDDAGTFHLVKSAQLGGDETFEDVYETSGAKVRNLVSKWISDYEFERAKLLRRTQQQGGVS